MAEETKQAFQYRRAPARPRKIADITPESDIRVRLLGNVIDKADGMLVIDDGTGRADIVAEEPAPVPGDFVRIFARVLPLETGCELRAELVQDMRNLDMSLHKRVYG